MMLYWLWTYWSVWLDSQHTDTNTTTSGKLPHFIPTNHTSIHKTAQVQWDHSCVTSGQASIENNRESITIDKYNREGVTVTGTGGYCHTASPQRVTSISEDGHVSVVCPERLVDPDSPALEEFVELSEDGRVSVILPERSDELGPRAHISVDRLKQVTIWP